LSEVARSTADYDEAVRLKLRDAVAFHNRGFAKYSLGRYEEAILDCDEAIRLDPNREFPMAFNNRGDAKIRLGRCEEAIVDLDCALRIDSRNKFARTNKGYALFHLGKYKEAKQEFEKALVKDSQFNDGFLVATRSEVSLC
jgi:tetratricopeptide (TPR) repeat protein